MNMYDSLHEIFGENLKRIVKGFGDSKMDKLEEIRLRANKPLIVNCNDGQFFIRGDSAFINKKDESYIVSSKDLIECLSLISGYSIYAFEEELKNGFITIKGGHRIGICGKTVVEKDLVKTIKHISSLNIRISHQIKGCADNVMSYIVEKNKVKHTIIVSPPRCGKTTLLRDITRQLSDGISSLNFKGTDVSVVDERSEIAGSYMGIPQNDVGTRTDILDCCPKAQGMRMLLRSMSPSVVAVDEIGRDEDIYAIEEMLNAGIKLICTVHGEGLSDIKQKPHLSSLIDKQLFETIIVLSGNAGKGRIDGIYNKELKIVYGGGQL